MNTPKKLLSWININLRLAALWLLPPLLWTGLPNAAFAHQPSDGFLQLNLDGRSLSGRWDFAIRDLDHAIHVDENQDGAVTWGELKSRRPEAAAYALDRLQIEADGNLLQLSITEQLVCQHSDGPYAVIQFAGTLPLSPRKIRVTYHALFDLDAQHRGFVRMQQTGQVQTAILSPGDRSHLFDLDQPNRLGEWMAFVRQGVWHIWIGFDHILFLIALLLPSVLRRAQCKWEARPDFRTTALRVLQIVTAFTLAHSLTLAIAAFEWVQLPPRWVESVIAASVAAAGLHNFRPIWPEKGWVVAFVFGLIHGFGFAGVLADLGARRDAIALGLTGFNVGVELGQLAIVAVFLPLAFALRRSFFYRSITLPIGSIAIVILGSVWLAERLFA